MKLFNVPVQFSVVVSGIFTYLALETLDRLMLPVCAIEASCFMTAYLGYTCGIKFVDIFEVSGNSNMRDLRMK